MRRQRWIDTEQTATTWLRSFDAKYLVARVCTRLHAQFKQEMVLMTFDDESALLY